MERDAHEAARLVVRVIGTMLPRTEEAWILKGDLHRIGRFRVVLEPILAAQRHHRTGHGLIECHMDDVEHVDSGIRQLSTRIIPEVAKIRIRVRIYTKAVGVKLPGWCGTQP